MPKQAKPATAANVPATAEALNNEQMTALIDKAQHGDMKAWSALKAGLDKVPDWETLYISPAQQARRALLDATVGNNPFVKEAWERRAQAMVTKLAGPDASFLDRTLCDRIATCWLDMSLTDLIYASRLKDGTSLAVGEYHQKAKDRAHKRYLTACLALAKVRRLLVPVAQQINIAQPGASQLNVTAPAQPATAPATLPDTPATVEADSPAAR